MNRESISSCALRVQQFVVDSVRDGYVETAVLPPKLELGVERAIVFIWAHASKGLGHKNKLNVTVTLTRKVTDEEATYTVMSVAGRWRTVRHSDTSYGFTDSIKGWLMTHLKSTLNAKS